MELQRKEAKTQKRRLGDLYSKGDEFSRSDDKRKRFGDFRSYT
jgi:hypothetical protein